MADDLSTSHPLNVWNVHARRSIEQERIWNWKRCQQENKLSPLLTHTKQIKHRTLAELIEQTPKMLSFTGSV